MPWWGARATTSPAPSTSSASWNSIPWTAAAQLSLLILLVLPGISACTNGPPDVAQRTADSTVPAVRITVEAGPVDRLQTPVFFQLNDGPRSAALMDSTGRRIPLQIGPGDRYWFIVDRLDRGEERSYVLLDDPAMPDTAITDPAMPDADVPAVPDSPVAATRDEAHVTFSTEDGPFIRYNFDPTPLPGTHVDSVYQRGGYIHPVLSPSGVELTDDYPPDHPHHHGIWAAWTKTVFQGRTPDFWNMGDRTGTVEPVALDSVWSGPVFAGLQARHAYIDLSGPNPMKALDESWTIRVFPRSQDSIRMFDLVVTQTTAEGTTLQLPEYRYGGVGFRGHRQWNGEENTFFVTSEGRNRSNGHATRARWCHIGGYVDGRLAGVAVLDHPHNFRSPQPMRIHPSEPFFNYAPSQLGDWTIAPDDIYTARYRFITYDGEPDTELIDRLWNDFADPPVVVIHHE